MSRVRPALLILALVVALGVGQATAQEPRPTPAGPPAPPPPLPSPQAARPGDVLWTFAQEPPFYDARVAMAIAALIDAELRAAGVQAYYAAIEGPRMGVHIDQGPAPVGQVPLLLTAAGFPDGLRGLPVVGPCRAVSIPADQPPSQAAVRIATLFQETLAELGAEIEPCTFASGDRDRDVQLYIWVEGGPAPVLTQRQEATLLALPGMVLGGADVAPPISGDAGLLASERSTLAATAIGGLALAVVAGLMLAFDRRRHLP